MEYHCRERRQLKKKFFLIYSILEILSECYASRVHRENMKISKLTKCTATTLSTRWTKIRVVLEEDAIEYDMRS